jgi:hypothetical protein
VEALANKPQPDNRSYVCRFLCLPLLAQDVVEAILAGRADPRSGSGGRVVALVKPQFGPRASLRSPHHRPRGSVIEDRYRPLTSGGLKTGEEGQ